MAVAGVVGTRSDFDYSGFYASAEKRAALINLLHDASDAHRVRDKLEAMQDDGSGSLQADYERNEREKKELADLSMSLPIERAHVVPAVLYAQVVAALKPMMDESIAVWGDIVERLVLKHEVTKTKKEKKISQRVAEEQSFAKLKDHVVALDLILLACRGWLADVDKLKKDVAALPDQQQAPQALKSGDVKHLMEAWQKLLSRGFELAHEPASCVLLVFGTSPLDKMHGGPLALFFNEHSTPKYVEREEVHRVAASMYKQSGATMFARVADKATLCFAHADLAGYATSVKGAQKEVDIFMRLLVRLEVLRNNSRSSGFLFVRVDEWSRRVDLEKAADALLQREASIKRPSWMDDKFKALSVQRWRDFLTEHGKPHLRMQADSIIDLNFLSRHAGLESSINVPLKIIKAKAKQTLAVNKLHAEKRASDARARLIEKAQKTGDDAEEVLRLEFGMSEAGCNLQDVQPSKLRSIDAIWEAMARFVHKAYAAGEDGRPRRDFSKWWSYPEEIALWSTSGDETLVPILNVFDQDHNLKNMRGMVAKVYEAIEAAKEKAEKEKEKRARKKDEDVVTEALPTLDDGADDDRGADDDEAGDAAALMKVARLADSPAAKIGLAAADVLKHGDERLLNPRVHESKFETQNVPIAAQLFSFETAREFRKLGHVVAAKWTAAAALEHEAWETRGYSAEARASMRRPLLQLIVEAAPFLLWSDARCSFPQYVGGFSRAWAEGMLVSDVSMRQAELMVSTSDEDAAINTLCDRNFGTNRVENSFMVIKRRYDSTCPTVANYKHGMAYMLERAITQMDQQRRFPFFYDAHTSYQWKQHEPNYRGCQCKPRCRLICRWDDGGDGGDDGGGDDDGGGGGGGCDLALIDAIDATCKFVHRRTRNLKVQMNAIVRTQKFGTSAAMQSVRAGVHKAGARVSVAVKDETEKAEVEDMVAGIAAADARMADAHGDQALRDMEVEAPTEQVGAPPAEGGPREAMER